MSERDEPETNIRGQALTNRPKDVSFLRLAIVLLEHRRSLVVVPLVAAILFVAGWQLLPTEYTSSGTFLPQDQQQSQLPRLSGLASQFGASLPVSIGAGQPPAFYAELIRSEHLLRQAVTHNYPATEEVGDEDSETGEVDLVKFFEASGETRAQRVASAVNMLREKISVGSDREIGVVTLSVTTGRPELSKQVADHLIELVNVFNLEQRRSQAEAERKFLEDQTKKAQADLEAAEDSLETFLERNRSFQNSPTLRFRHQDLQRQVDMEQQVYTSLMQSLQQARLEEVRSTPVITVVEPPQVPATPDGRSLLLVAVFGLVVGELGAVAWALGDQYFRAARETEPEEYARFRELRRQIVSDLRGLWRGLRGRG